MHLSILTDLKICNALFWSNSRIRLAKVNHQEGFLDSQNSDGILELLLSLAQIVNSVKSTWPMPVDFPMVFVGSRRGFFAQLRNCFVSARE
jgi:hypothetical protein